MISEGSKNKIIIMQVFLRSYLSRTWSKDLNDRFSYDQAEIALAHLIVLTLPEFAVTCNNDCLLGHCFKASCLLRIFF